MNKFRKSFDFSKIGKELYQWFPGHMAKGLKKMYEELPNVDAVIQVHDARIPFTGRNRKFRQMIIGNKPYVYVLNKSDLADLSQKEKILRMLKNDDYNPAHFAVMKTNADKTIKLILPNLIKQIESRFRFNRVLSTSFNIMVIGVPNVGKSTLINRLRNVHLKQGNAVRVGAEPGITRAVQMKVKVNENPAVYLLDTPGVLEPSFDDIETGFKLACLNCIKNHQVNSSLLADYLLFKLNEANAFKYVEFYGLKEPTDDIFDLLVQIAKSKKKINLYKSSNGSIKKVYDVDSVAHAMIKSFFDGDLGKIMLDNQHLLDNDDDDKRKKIDSNDDNHNESLKGLDVERFV